ncbi:hypothetical protein GA830_16295 [Mesorhizobium sp. NBSH29]|uniref:BA14K family protein n=1 Tax=Mesorhizobium sp. NBSH29 TaxID=2654249 RepID=UPI0018967B1B|nr:BA14K family protein [Mesorhizobium sp. NBSH29]QPC88137.1 hypothetical protein GA830_16295 [Mesorhizobium sp. NBSH29]
MLCHLVFRVRTGLMALTITSVATAGAFASPASLTFNPADKTSQTIHVQGDGRFSDCMRSGGNCYRPGIQFEGYRSRPAEDWDRSREWRRHEARPTRRHHVDRGWDRARHYRRHHYRPDYYGPSYGSGIYFNYSAPSYRYYEPRRYAPARRVHRATNAHIRWCQSRYRTYRAWDNTYKPTQHTRRQCWSPYS